MVKLESEDKKSRIVFLSSIATSIAFVGIFLSGAILTNISREETAYTLVDMAAGSIFVFVIAMIISLSLWPRFMDWLENREKNRRISK